VKKRGPPGEPGEKRSPIHSLKKLRRNVLGKQQKGAKSREWSVNGRGRLDLMKTENGVNSAGGANRGRRGWESNHSRQGVNMLGKGMLINKMNAREYDRKISK